MAMASSPISPYLDRTKYFENRDAVAVFQNLHLACADQVATTSCHLQQEFWAYLVASDVSMEENGFRDLDCLAWVKVVRTPYYSTTTS